MSGGAWGYERFKIEEEGSRISALYHLLAEIEWQLDRGVSGDDCRQCAFNRTGAALCEFFEHYRVDASTALALVKDRDQNRCPAHEDKS